MQVPGGPSATQKGLRCVGSVLTLWGDIAAVRGPLEQQHVACSTYDVSGEKRPSVCSRRRGPPGTSGVSVSGVPPPLETLSALLPRPAMVPCPKPFQKNVSRGGGGGAIWRGDMDSSGPVQRTVGAVQRGALGSPLRAHREDSEAVGRPGSGSPRGGWGTRTVTPHSCAEQPGPILQTRPLSTERARDFLEGTQQKMSRAGNALPVAVSPFPVTSG